MNFLYSKTFRQNAGTLIFSHIFEGRRNFKRIYTLPFNTLVAVLDDGGSGDSTMENRITHEIRSRRKYDLYFTPVELPVLYTALESLHFIALHFNLFRYPGMDVYHGCKDWIFENNPEAVRKMDSAFHAGDPLQSLTALRACCLDFCARHWPENQVIDPKGFADMQPVIDWIHTHVSADINIDDLAGRVSMSPVVFARKFKVLFGKSPKEYLQTELAARAAALLSDPANRVKDVASALGFSSEFYFSKFFKRMIGCTPSEYKEQA